MAKVLVVTSGKGGVGKTTTSAALGAALAQLGQNVVVVDFDVGLRNLDLIMGAEAAVHMAASVSGMLGGAGAAQRGRPHARARAGSPRPPRAGATG